MVITDKKVVREVGDLTTKGLRKMTHNTKNPIGRMFMRFFMGKRSAEITWLAAS